MEILYYSSGLCLLIFSVLATFDGIYLHLWKFELFNHSDSKFEHKTHTARAILFPFIVWFLFIQSNELSFWIGLFLVVLDLVVLGIDAYSETESRAATGGLPKWEYIIHLFSNGFHFAAILLIIIIRVIISEVHLKPNAKFSEIASSEFLDFIAANIIPGSIFFALLHLLLILPFGRKIWNKNRARVTCC